MASSDWTFPMQTADALVDFYRTDVLTGQEAKHLTKSDLVPTPKTEAVQTLYTRVLQLLFNFRPERHAMVPLLENIQYPEYHEGAAFILSVNARMKQFMPSCMVSDFTLSDLLSPKKTRTLSHLSAIMGFLQFRKQRMIEISDKLDKLRVDKERHQFYLKGVKEAEKKIQILKTIPPEQRAEADQLGAALSELRKETAQVSQKVSTKKVRAAELKTQIAEKTQKLAQMKVDIINHKEEITKLKSQIVESPEELKSQMEDMREKVKNIKKSIEEADERVVELQNMTQTANHTEAEFQLMYNQLQDLESSINTTQQRQEEIQELKAQFEKKQKELKNLHIEESQLKQALEKKLDIVTKQNIRRNKKKEMKEQRVQDVLGQCDRMQQKREEMADKIQEIFTETKQVKAKIQSLRDICSKEKEKAQALYNTLLTSMNELNGRVEMHMADLICDRAKMMPFKE